MRSHDFYADLHCGQVLGVESKFVINMILYLPLQEDMTLLNPESNVPNRIRTGPVEILMSVVEDQFEQRMTAIEDIVLGLASQTHIIMEDGLDEFSVPVYKFRINNSQYRGGSLDYELTISRDFTTIYQFDREYQAVDLFGGNGLNPEIFFGKDQMENLPFNQLQTFISMSGKLPRFDIIDNSHKNVLFTQ